MRYDVITIGDAFEDVFVVPEEAKIKRDNTFSSGQSLSFELGDKIPLNQVDYEIGGSACNVSVGLSRLSFKSSLITILGDDTPAVRIKQRLEKEDVSIDNFIIDKKMKTNFSVIFRTIEGRTIFIYHGLKDYSGLRIKKSVKTDWIFLAPTGQNTKDLQTDIVREVSEKNTRFAWNPGSLQIKEGAGKFKSLLSNCSVIFLNREEALELTKTPVRPSDKELLKKVAALGPKIVVITYGKKGAKAYDGKNFYEVGALEVPRVDSTGAGDSFTTGFLGRIFLEKIDFSNIDQTIVSEALKWGIFNSNSVIQFVGAQPGLLNLAKIKKSSLEYKRLKVEVN